MFFSVTLIFIMEGGGGGALASFVYDFNIMFGNICWLMFEDVGQLRFDCIQNVIQHCPTLDDVGMVLNTSLYSSPKYTSDRANVVENIPSYYMMIILLCCSMSEIFSCSP